MSWQLSVVEMISQASAKPSYGRQWINRAYAKDATYEELLNPGMMEHLDVVLITALDQCIPMDKGFIRQQLKTERHRLGRLNQHMTGRALLLLIHRDLSVGEKEQEATDKLRIQSVKLNNNDVTQLYGDWELMVHSLNGLPEVSDLKFSLTLQLHRLSTTHPL